MTNRNVEEYCRARRFSKAVVEGGIEYLIQNWKRLVRLLSAPYTSGIDEYRNSLTSRSILEEVLPLVTDAEREAILPTLREVDAEFMRLTVPSVTQVYNKKDAPKEWWWLHRLPP